MGVRESTVYPQLILPEFCMLKKLISNPTDSIYLVVYNIYSFGHLVDPHLVEASQSRFLWRGTCGFDKMCDGGSCTLINKKPGLIIKV